MGGSLIENIADELSLIFVFLTLWYVQLGVENPILLFIRYLMQFLADPGQLKIRKMPIAFV
jgi:hypothetical protein